LKIDTGFCRERRPHKACQIQRAEITGPVRAAGFHAQVCGSDPLTVPELDKPWPAHSNRRSRQITDSKSAATRLTGAGARSSTLGAIFAGKMRPRQTT
jgi:hypothetical protein